MLGRAIATARSSLTFGCPGPEWRTRVSTSPRTRIPTMKATRDQLARLSRLARLGRGSVSSEEEPDAECEVAKEVGEEGELDPPELVPPVHPLLPGLDPGQVDRDRPREQEDVRKRPHKEKDDHARLV